MSRSCPLLQKPPSHPSTPGARPPPHPIRAFFSITREKSSTRRAPNCDVAENLSDRRAESSGVAEILSDGRVQSSAVGEILSNAGAPSPDDGENLSDRRARSPARRVICPDRCKRNGRLGAAVEGAAGGSARNRLRCTPARGRDSAGAEVVQGNAAQASAGSGSALLRRAQRLDSSLRRPSSPCWRPDTRSRP